MLNCLYVVFCHTARSEHIKSFKGRNGIRLRVGLRLKSIFLTLKQAQGRNGIRLRVGLRQFPKTRHDFLL